MHDAEKLLSWVEIDKKALTHNIQELRKAVGSDVILAPCVKANAYGHGLVVASKIFLEAGADWLCVDSLHEARILRNENITAPIYVMGYIPLASLGEVFDLDVRVVVYNTETIEKLAQLAEEKKQEVKVHIKLETGTNRQGVPFDKMLAFAQKIQSLRYIVIEGLSTHFANIEDTDNQTFFRGQLAKLNEADELLKQHGIDVSIKHCANGAATILYPETHLQMVRPGIPSYGIWPSQTVKDACEQTETCTTILKPAFTWKTRIVQIKTLQPSESVSYGRTFVAKKETRIAVLPVGYYEGYDRKLSNESHVIVHGTQAPVLGRVCMNMMVVDVSDAPEAQVEDEVILIGGNEQSDSVPFEQYAQWVDRITYELPTRVSNGVHEEIPRIIV